MCPEETSRINSVTETLRDGRVRRIKKKFLGW